MASLSEAGGDTIQSEDFAPLELAQAQGDAESIGKVSSTQGTVTITHPDGTKVEAAGGTPIFQGDVIETGGDGAVGITFADDSTFSLADNGNMTIDEMVYDASAQTGKSALSVAEGVFTFVSGQIAKTDVNAMTITTPVAVIGIRGTAGGGKAAAEGTNNTFSMFADPGGGAGEMTITTQGGSQTMNTPNQTCQIASAYVPPTRPVVLPAAAMKRFYAKAAVVAPREIPATQPSDDDTQGGPSGPTDAGPTDDTSAAVEDAEKAAEQAFEQALAESGGDLDAAMNAAQGAATEANIKAVLAVNAEAFGSEHAGQSVLDNVVDKAFLGVTGRIDMGGAGTGAGPGHNSFTDSFFQDPVDRYIANEINEIVGGLFGDFLDFGPGGNGLDVTQIGFQDPFAIFENQAFQDAFDITIDDFLFDVFTPLTFEDGVLGFDEDPFFLDEGEEAFITTSVFDDFLVGSTGNDSLTGGDGNSRFTMIQGSTLGGTDTINGGNGTDELALEDLSNIAVIFDGSTNTVAYSGIGGSVSGSATLNSVEQIFADDGALARVRLPTDLADADAGFTGYIVAGGTGADTITLADTTNLNLTYNGLSDFSSSSLFTVNASNTFGAIIFAGANNDTVTGSAGGDIIYGGAGNDIINPGPVPTDDGDILIGGAGDDTFLYSTAGSYFGSIKAGTLDGTDTSTADKLSFSATGAYNFTQNIITGIDNLAFTATGITLTLVGSKFTGITGNVTSSGTTTLKGQSGIDLSNATNTGGGVTALTIDFSLGNGGTLSDFNDTIGRTLTATTAQDQITGNGGGDTIDVGADSVADTVIFKNKADTAASAGAATAGTFDVVTNFGSQDLINFNVAATGTLDDFDDVGTADGSIAQATVATNGANLSTTEVVFISNTVTTGDLTTANFVNVIAAIGTVTAGTATATDAQNDAIFILNDGSATSGIYFYTNADGAGANNTTVELGELTLLATVDEVLTSGGLVQFTGFVSFSATVSSDGTTLTLGDSDPGAAIVVDLTQVLAANVVTQGGSPVTLTQTGTYVQGVVANVTINSAITSAVTITTPDASTPTITTSSGAVTIAGAASSVSVNASSLDVANTLTLQGTQAYSVTGLAGNITASAATGTISVTTADSSDNSIAITSGSGNLSLVANFGTDTVTVDATALADNGSVSVSAASASNLVVNNVQGTVTVGANLTGTLTVTTADATDDAVSIVTGSAAVGLTANFATDTVTVDAAVLAQNTALTVAATSASALTVTGLVGNIVATNLTGALTVTTGDAGDNGISITTGSAATSLTAAAATDTVTVNATTLANNTALTVAAASASALTVTNLIGDIVATNLTGALTVTTADNTVDNGVSITTGSAAVSLTANIAGDTATVNAATLANNTALTVAATSQSALTVTNLVGDIVATNLSGALTVTTADNTVDNGVSITTGSAAVSLTANIAADTVTVNAATLAQNTALTVAAASASNLTVTNLVGDVVATNLSGALTVTTADAGDNGISITAGTGNLALTANFGTDTVTVNAAAMTGAQTITVAAASASNLTINNLTSTGALNAANLSGVLDVTAGAGAQNITGGSGADLIEGGAGADTLIGGAGDDSFIYLATADLFSGTALVDAAITGGTGTGDAIAIDNAAGTTFTIAATDVFTGVTGVEKITADVATAQIISISLSDAVAALGITTVDLSTDTNATGANVIDVSAESTTAYTLIGSAGTDTITGGGGADTLTGNGAADTFKYNATGDFGDTITDFAAGTDKLQFDISNFLADTNSLLTTGDGTATSTDTAGGATVSFQTVAATGDFTTTAANEIIILSAAAFDSAANIQTAIQTGGGSVMTFSNAADSGVFLVAYDTGTVARIAAVTVSSATTTASATVTDVAELTGISDVTTLTTADFDFVA